MYIVIKGLSYSIMMFTTWASISWYADWWLSQGSPEKYHSELLGILTPFWGRKTGDIWRHQPMVIKEKWSLLLNEVSTGWLVVYLPLRKMMDFVSWDDDYSQLNGKIIQPCSKPPTCWKCCPVSRGWTEVSPNLTPFCMKV